MKDDTLLTHAGRDPQANFGIVNPPVYHASTILFPTLNELLHERRGPVHYGRTGTPTTFALQDAMVALEGGHGATVTPSGLAALAGALTACVKAGDHILVMDSLYYPTRRFCNQELARFGVETEFFPPDIGAGIADLIRPNTSVVFLESVGSQTFEVPDIPAIAEAAHAAGAIVIDDNTWGAGYCVKPMQKGVDVVVHAGTKYVVGHADAMLGIIVWNEACADVVRRSVNNFGHCAGPDDVYLALRGLRTMGVRLARHHDSGLKIARWLAARPEVSRVMHPALPDDPGHALWKRDFSSACGLFGFVLKVKNQKALASMLEDLELFGMGYSWGGYESLLIPTWPEKSRVCDTWHPDGQTMRIHVGLEDPDDLIADLEAGFDRLNNAG